MQIIRAKALVDVPWKNAGGITRNIAKGLVREYTAWTLSHADVVIEGAFSDFSGMTQLLTVVVGETMILETKDTPIIAEPSKPVRFYGGLAVKPRLTDCPITDLNLMFNPDQFDGTVISHSTP